MINLIGTALNQWDVGRSVTVTESEATHVHFANLGDTKAVIMELVESQSKIPDYLLQTGKQLCVYAVANGVTIERRTFPVTKRERPEDYVYEDDQRNYIYEFLHSVAGKKTEEGGEIFNDYTTNKATAEFATAFGSESKAAGECSIAGGRRIFKVDAEYVVAREYFDGEAGWTLLAYAADPNGEYAKNTISFDSAMSDLHMEEGKTYECWMDVSEWLAFEEENGFTVPDLIMTADGRFCLLEDVRYNEAYGTGAMAIGKGAVAYSRASKSFGYRTQTGYPPSEEHAKARPEAIVKTDSNGNPEYPADNVGQAAFAIGADTAALGNQDFAGGWGSVARGYQSMAFGDHCETNGYAATALGNKVKANGEHALSCGFETRANGNCSVAGGASSVADGACAVAVGKSVMATQEGSVAMGRNSVASGLGAAAFGSTNTSSGSNSFTAGVLNEASGNCSTAIGYKNKALGVFQTVVGQHNKSVLSALFIVGNGTSDTDRKNAFEVKQDGSATIAGKLSFGSIDATSRNKILAHKTSYNTPTINDKGDYVGQIWLVLSKEDDTTSDVYMYVGVNLGGYYWQKL